MPLPAGLLRLGILLVASSATCLLVGMFRATCSSSTAESPTAHCKFLATLHASSIELDYLRSLGFLLPKENIVSIRARHMYSLDLLSGPDSPLSCATKRAGIPTLPPIDAHPRVGGQAHDLTCDKICDLFLRLAWAGCVALGAASPPCSAYSLLRLFPHGPRAIRTHDNLFRHLTAP